MRRFSAWREKGEGLPKPCLCSQNTYLLPTHTCSRCPQTGRLTADRASMATAVSTTNKERKTGTRHGTRTYTGHVALRGTRDHRWPKLWPMMRRVAVADATRALRCHGWHEIR
eukprot:205309-Prymnesium_polylepis.1